MTRIYFGTLTSGFCVLNKVTGKLNQYKHVPGDRNSIQSNTICAIFLDAKNNIWVSSTLGVATFNKGIFNRIPIKNLPYFNPLANLVNHFYQLSNGNIIAAAHNGIICFEKKGNSF